MTYFQPKKISIRWSLFTLITAVIAAAVVNVYFYSYSVSIKYALADFEKKMLELNSENTELKSKLFALLDFKNPDEFAARFNLVKDSKPQYGVSLLGQ